MRCYDLIRKYLRLILLTLVGSIDWGTIPMVVERTQRVYWVIRQDCAIALQVNSRVHTCPIYDVSLVLRRVYFDSVGDLANSVGISEWFLHSLTYYSRHRVAWVFNQPFLVEHLVLSGHKNFRVLFNVIGLSGCSVSRAGETFIRACAMKFKLRLAAVVRKRAIWVAVREAAMIVAVVATAWPIVVLILLILSIGDLNSQVVSIRWCRLVWLIAL